MPNSLIFNNTYRLLEKSIGLSARRHKLLSNNIANINTVGYQARDIDFQKTLAQEMSRPPADLATTHPEHYRQIETAAGPDETSSASNPDIHQLDSVDIDEAMTSLMENNIQYKTSVELLLRKIGMIRNAIIEGGKS